MDENAVMAENHSKKANKEQLADKRHREILGAARHVFAEKGFRVATIDDIANYLSVGKGTIYRYFHDKKALFIAVFENGMQQLMATMYSHIDAVVTPDDKIRCAVKTFFEFFDENRELVEIGMQMRSDFKDEHKRVFMSLYQDYIVRIQNNLRAGIAQGIFREMDIEKTAEAMSATTQGLLQSFYIREVNGTAASEKRQKLTDRTDAVCQLILQGLLKR
jgi:AcrR family transcriptional regulator